MESSARMRLLAQFVPTWEIRYDDLAEVQAVGKIPLFSTGVRFRATSTNEWIVFWTFNRPKVLQANFKPRSAGQ
jgi:hypothetical protein